MTIRRWTEKPDVMHGTLWNVGGTISVLDGPSLGTPTGSLVSLGHDLRDLGHGDVGGVFRLNKTDYTNRLSKMYNPRGYTGDAGPANPKGLLTYTIPTDLSLYASGTTAIANTTPTNPVFDGATFLGESLADGLPSVVGASTWRAKTLQAKQAGGEYLNVQFGWLPFVSDLRNFAFAVKHSSEIIDQMKKDADSKIRRRFRFPPSHQYDMSIENSFIKVAQNRSVGSTTTYYYRAKIEETWFSGCYRFYLPLGNDATSRFKRYKAYAHKLLGLRLTPEAVWNVAPWSWAVDWKTDVGDVIANVSNLGHDGLALQYGYIMNSKRSVSTSSSMYGYRDVVSCSKIRLPATPYGFGVDVSGLTARQLSIIAALGLSKT